MNISISLTPELVALVRQKVDSGLYTSTSEVIREALRQFERSEVREAQLRDAWKQGVDSGDAGPVDFSELKAVARRELKSTKTQ